MTESSQDPLRSLIASGTKLYLDSVDPDEIDRNLAYGAVGATSNPAIIAEIVRRGSLDDEIERLIADGRDDESIAWELTDHLVTDAERKFIDIWKSTGGNAGWVSFELDPLLEEAGPDGGTPRLSVEEIAEQYLTLGKRWSEGHPNRMIKVPATEGGLAALERMAASGITLNVTLMFTADQYLRARDAIWRGAQRHGNLDSLKSVYSIFISRIDVYTAKHLPELSEDAQGKLGILNAKRIWRENQTFWKDKPVRLEQELIFASTGTKDPSEPAWKYVEALAGSDIQTNPPETNRAVAESGRQFERTVDAMPAESVQRELDQKVDLAAMHETLMREGVDKFAQPQRGLLALIGEKRQALSAT